MQSDNQTETITLEKGSQADLAKVIAESTSNLEDASAPKRPRGRPMGWRKNKENAAPAGDGGPSQMKAKAVQSDVVKINEIEPLAAEICKAPFDFVGWKAGVSLETTDDDVKAPARYLSKLINAYIPDLESKDPKIFAWAAFGISYMLLAVKKLRILFANKAKEKNESAEVVENEKGEHVVQNNHANFKLPAESVSASSVFRRG